MKQALVTSLTTVLFLLMTAHRLPAPITENPESPSATPISKTTRAEPPEQKVNAKKRKPKAAENEGTEKRTEPEAARVSVSGTWHGHWDNSRGEQGTTFVVFNEGAGGVITGETQALPLSARPPLQNGHRSGNTITFTFHRGNRDYHDTMTLSPDGTTLSGQYTVIQDQKVIYTGKLTDFKRR